MSVQYTVENDILRITFESGTISEEIYSAVNRAYQDPACPDGANIMFDLSASTSIHGRSVEGIRNLSQFMLDHPSRPGRRIAILLDAVEAERLTPLADEFAEQTGLEIRVFEDERAASAWLASGSQAASD